MLMKKLARNWKKISVGDKFTLPTRDEDDSRPMDSRGLFVCFKFCNQTGIIDQLPFLLKNNRARGVDSIAGKNRSRAVCSVEGWLLL